MNEAPENFETLQTLLKLKRHEVPPPGYFNNFSTIVTNGIEREMRQMELNRTSWIRKMFSFFETNPMTAGLFGVGICGLLAVGITFNEEHASNTFATGNGVTLDVAENSPIAALPDLDKASKSGFVAASLDPVFGGDLAGLASSGIDRLSVQPVNFQFSR